MCLPLQHTGIFASLYKTSEKNVFIQFRKKTRIYNHLCYSLWQKRRNISVNNRYSYYNPQIGMLLKLAKKNSIPYNSMPSKTEVVHDIDKNPMGRAAGLLKHDAAKPYRSF